MLTLETHIVEHILSWQQIQVCCLIKLFLSLPTVSPFSVLCPIKVGGSELSCYHGLSG